MTKTLINQPFSAPQMSGAELRVIDTLEGLDQHRWDACVGSSGGPFMRYAFLRGLERCRCVGDHVGWSPRYLLLERGEELIGATAAYRKTHSQGEFIFDWAWADAAHRAGLPYYPKLTVTSPFSPVSGEKLMLHECLASAERDDARSALLFGLRALTRDEPTTGLHLLFITADEAERCAQHDLLIRHTLQFQWTNEGYQTFDDFLARFRSKRRNQIRRERRVLREEGVVVNVYQGDQIKPDHIPLIYGFYRATVEKYFFGNLYLSLTFFEHLYDTLRDHLCLLLAERDGEVLGGSFNLIDDGVLYGRYWGCDDEKSVPFLHFEVCAYRGIELCIERGWRRFEAGAGGGGHKFGRGFLPRVIRSAHEVYLPGFEEALSEFLNAERAELATQLELAQGEVLKVESPR